VRVSCQLKGEAKMIDVDGVDVGALKLRLARLERVQGRYTGSFNILDVASGEHEVVMRGRT
jgi:hypothetical protein